VKASLGLSGFVQRFFRRPTAAPPPRPSTGRRGGGRPLARHLLLGAALLAFGGLVSSSALAAAPTRFGAEGSGAGEFLEPHGIAVDRQSGDTYVGDRNNDRVDEFGPAGEFIRAFGWGVADSSTEALQVCTSRCYAGLPGSGAGQFAGPEGLAIDNSGGPSAGDVYVVDPSNLRVEKFSPDGEFLLMFGGEVDKTSHADLCTEADLEAGDQCGAGVAGTGPGEFEILGPDVVAVGPTGGVYIGERERVQRFGPEGTFDSQTALAGAGVVYSLAVDSAGDLYAIGELPGVRKYDPATGNELGAPRDPAADQFGAVAEVGPADDLFVYDSEAGHLLAYDPSGKQLASTFEAGEAQARGITFDASGSVYFLHNESVHVLTPATPGTPYLLPGSESAAPIGATTATLDATLNPEGAAGTTYHLEYGTTTAYGEETAESAPLEPADEIQAVTLKADRGSYLLRFEGEATLEIPFAAPASEVQADLEALATVGASNVAVTGPEGGPYAVEFTAALGGSDQPGLEAEPGSLKEVTEENGEERIRPGTVSVATTNTGRDLFDDRQASAAITGLQPATTYHFRVLATNAAARTTTGPDQSFQTLPSVSILSTSASLVTATSARLETELDPNGLPTGFHFQYGTTTAYGQSAPVPDASAGEATTPGAFAVAIQGLTPGTTYHFRVVAENPLGPVAGPDATFTTQGSLASLLPDGREWELVSPPDKHGSPLESFYIEGSDIQAAASGGAITYVSNGPVLARPGGNRSLGFSQDLSRRGPAGWETEDVTTPNEAATGIAPGAASEYRLFSEDLSLAALEPEGGTPLSPRATERTPYLRLADGEFEPLVNPGNVPKGIEFGREGNFVALVGANADDSDIVVSSGASLTPDFTEGFAPPSGLHSLFEWHQGALELLSWIPSGPAARCGGAAAPCVPAVEAGVDSKLGLHDQLVRNAISADGDRAIFQAVPIGEGETQLDLRDTALGQTIRLDAPQPGVNPGDGEPLLQAASADDSKVFFLDFARLTADSTARPSSHQPDLYMCDVEVSAGQLGCNLSDLSVDADPGRSARVLGVPGADTDGRLVYFVADGRLAPGAVQGDCEAGASGAAESCNLYVRDTLTGTTRFIAVLSGADSTDWASPDSGRSNLGHVTSRVSPDGRWFAFMSQRPLTGFDNRDARSGEPDQEVFLYDAAANGGEGKLICASCNPSGSRPTGIFDNGLHTGLLVDRPKVLGGHWLAASIPGWTPATNPTALYQSRYLSDSGRLFFNAADSLVPQDSNGTFDVYEYEPPQGPGQPASNSCTTASSTYSSSSAGCVNLISSGTSGEESAFMDASKTGDDVFFLTASKLAATDVDSALDLYDAHVCTAELPCPAAPPPSPPACEGDACQAPATPPVDATPGSLTFNGAGNVLECPKGKVKQKGRCVKKSVKKSKKHKKSKKSGKKNSGKHHSKGGRQTPDKKSGGAR
jgi:WD40-like Beta Propeller Repeat